MIRFVPIYKEALWGGERFATEFGRPVSVGRSIGESWELVELDSCESRAAGGPEAGRGLGELWRAGCLGGSARGRFPFILKWLDTRQRLSVQVHPDVGGVGRLGKGTAKNEAWFVAEAEPGAALWMGHYPGLDATTLRLAATGGTISKWLYEVRPRVGDMYPIAAGTLHCIGQGFLILEVQEPSDTTYRLYDWGRTDAQGQPRPLHIDEGCASVAYERSGAPRAEREGLEGPSYAMRVLHSGAEVAADGLRIFVADSGPTTLQSSGGETLLAYGDVMAAEPSDGVVRVVRGTSVLVGEAGLRLVG